MAATFEALNSGLISPAAPCSIRYLSTANRIAHTLAWYCTSHSTYRHLSTAHYGPFASSVPHIPYCESRSLSPYRVFA
eukprot:2512112-Rhodomonas_salina.1